MHKTVLVPIDLNSDALTEKVISEVEYYSVLVGTCFCFLAVIPPAIQYCDYGFGYPVTEDDVRTDDEHVKAATEALKKVVARFDIPEEKVTCAVEFGNPKDVILDTAEKINADLIIMGSRHPNFKTHVLGSTASSIVHYAKTSVFVVR